MSRSWPILRFVAGRVLAGVAIVFAVSVLVFVAVELLPGDPVSAALGRSVPPEIRADLRAEYGLDRPVPERYWEFVSGLARGDLGESIVQRQPVATIVGPRIGNTIALAAVSAAVLLPLALVTGVLAGARPGSRLDRLLTGVSLALLSIPEFVLGGFLAVAVGVWLGWVPPVSLLPPGASPFAHLDLLVLPAATMVLVDLGFAARIVRAAVVESLEHPCVHMARMNGVSERRIVLRYGLRNALAPVIQVGALMVVFLFAATLVVETVFQYPGIGLLLAQAGGSRDVALLQTMTVVVAAVVVAVNIVADLLVVLVTPRLRTAT